MQYSLSSSSLLYLLNRSVDLLGCRMPIRLSLLTISFWLAALGSTKADPVTGDQRDFFENRIRPALTKYCYECHSAKAEEVGGKLFLDSKDGILEGGESGPAILAGDHEKSLLIQALLWGDTAMPPDEPLPPNIVRDFERWVKMGAPDPRVAPSNRPKTDEKNAPLHWAFHPIRDAELPTNRDTNWARDPIDQFVLSRLHAEKLTPTQDASARTLVRRVYYDLTGLPPTKQELDIWISRLSSESTLEDGDSGDLQQGAFADLVDELLASPHFGERWGRHWLDVARYGESNGNDGLARNPTFPHAWRYRDYVIRAFNQDTPYDRFLMEQIAGDLLKTESELQRDWNKVATGFLALGSKPAKAMNVNFDMDVVADQIGVVSSGIMGLSVACARCHDHKHDPIPTRDYYALAGIFKSTTTMWGSAANEKLSAPATALHELKVLKRQDTKQVDFGPGVPKFPNDYEETIQSLSPIIYSKLDGPHPDLQPEGDAKLDPNSFATMGKGRIRGKIKKPIDSYSVSFWFRNDLKSDSVIMTAYLFSFANRAQHEGVGDHLGISGTYKGADPGHLFLFPGAKDIPSVTGPSIIPEHTWNHVVLVRDGERVRLQLNGVDKLEIDSDIGPSFQKVQEFTLGSRSDGMFSLQGNMNEFAFFDRALTREEAKLLHSASGQLQKSGPTQPAPMASSPNNVAMGVREAQKAEDCKVNINGESKQLGPSVPRGFLSAWTEPDSIQNSQASGRLELAEWLTAPEHPLTSRVMVNRVWQHLMGRPIVSTPDDFGVYGGRPTHPELLDHLATRFVRNDWSVKRLIRAIVLSRTYQLDSNCDPETFTADPDNNWYARHKRRRLDAEAIRDSILKATGQLNPQPGIGSDVQSLDVQVNNMGDSIHQPSNHRSIYLCMLRNSPPPDL
ncbi:MAG: DUF1549 domain-containing protein, partial [Planctomycetota bacterium]